MKKNLELYIHIPFCMKKCAYCDFLSGSATDEQKQAYLDALILEIQNCGDFSEYEVSSIFFGGGTPSVFSGAWIAQIMAEIRDKFQFQENAEITIEANPGTVDMEKLTYYRKAGINRVSFGCQSSDNTELKLLGRIHTWGGFLESYELARMAGFENINVDLMSGLPGQTVTSWEETLRKVAALQPEHISAYSLIIEEGTPFYEMEEQLHLPEEDAERLMYEQTAKILKSYGYEQYEISNYAKEGKACQHNIGYWTGVEYLGLGLGASSLVNHCRFSNTNHMEEYLKYSHKPEQIRQDIQLLSQQEEMEEFMILGLRMNCGVSESEFLERYHCGIDDVYGPVLEKYVSGGFLVRENGRIFFTREGISVSNVILADFLG